MVKMEIPVTPLVKWWLLHKHGESLQVNHKCIYGNQLYLSLSRKPLDSWDLSEAKYCKTHTIYIPTRAAKRIGKHLETQAIIDFNKAVKNVFLSFFYGLMDYRRATTTLSVEKIYYEFVDVHPGLEEVFDWRRAAKGYARYGKEKKNNQPMLKECG